MVHSNKKYLKHYEIIMIYGHEKRQLNGRNNQIGDNQFDRHIAKLVL